LIKLIGNSVTERKLALDGRRVTKAGPEVKHAINWRVLGSQSHEGPQPLRS
jgi:hypothetical protein